MTYFRLYHVTVVVWLMAGVALGIDVALLSAAYNAAQSGQQQTALGEFTPQELAEITVHGNSHSSDVLAGVSNEIISFANFFDAKNLNDMNFVNFPNLLADLEAKRKQICPDVSDQCKGIDLKYRPITGGCNNLKNPRLGAAFTAQTRPVPANWEDGAIIKANLPDGDGGYSVSLNPLGVPRKLPLLLHIPPKTQTEIWFLKEDLVQFEQKCKAGELCFVDGQINTLEAKRKNRCKYGEHFSFSGNRIFASDGCTKFIGDYQEIAAKVRFNTENIAESFMEVGGQTVRASPRGEPRVPDLYWIDRRGDMLIVGHGTECDTQSELMRTSVNLPEVPEGLVAMAAKSVTGNTTIGIPIRRRLQLETWAFNGVIGEPGNTVKSLDDVPWTYGDGSLILGISVPEDGATTEVILRDDNADGAVTVVFGDSSEIKSDFGDTQVLTGPTNNIPFEDSNGNPVEGFKAVWISWLANRIYVGLGNVIGQNSFQQVHDFNAKLSPTIFSAKRVFLRSFVRASWLVNIAQRNIPQTTSITGRPLPSPREVSLGIHATSGNETTLSKVLTIATFQFGQLLDHDIISTPTEHHTEHCCPDFTLSPNPDRFCFPIKITNKFPDRQGLLTYPEHECLDFFRAAAILDCHGADIRDRFPMNTITPFVDASNVYGSQPALADDLRVRAANNDLLAELKLDDGELPPQETPTEGEGGACFPSNAEHKCRFAGDSRSQEQPSLAAIHTLSAREHNRVVNALVNVGWPNQTIADQEVLYQEARRFVIAVMQVITYDGFLPSFMDRGIMESHSLLIDNKCDYDPDLDPRISVVMGIAYRLGHTWIPDLIDELNEIPLHTQFFNPDVSYSGTGSDSILLNLPRKCPGTDRFLQGSVLQRLFSKGDLAALNIQRGRDIGAGAFCEVYEHFLKKKCPSTFQDMVDQKFITQEVADKLKECYDCVADIDLFTGLLVQIPMNQLPNSQSKSTIGELLNLILADFFRRVKCGDRYWFENVAAGFTSRQINELKRASLSRLLCDNTATIKEIQPDIFLAADVEGNKKRSCTARGKIRRVRMKRFKPPKGTRDFDEDDEDEEIEEAREEVEDDLDEIEDLLAELNELDDL